jgi:hypothetical protein
MVRWDTGSAELTTTFNSIAEGIEQQVGYPNDARAAVRVLQALART